MKNLSVKFLKFAVVGFANTAIDWVVFFLLVRALPPFTGFEAAAKAGAFLVAVLNSFIFNSLWTFRQEVERDRSVGASLWDPGRCFRFLATSLGGLLINVTIFSLARSASSSLPDTYSRLFSLSVATILSLVWNFIVNLKWTYKEKGERKKLFLWDKLATLALVVLFVLAAVSSIFDSVTTDEVAHIAAGYQYLTSGRMYLNLEHPPIVKLISAAPLMLLDLEVPSLYSVAKEDADLSKRYWETQWNYGYKVIFGQKVGHRLLLFLTRLPLVAILCLAGWFLYLLGKRLFGPKVGLVSLAVFALSPSFFAHGRLVTTDVAATLGLVSALYFFHRFLEGESSFVAAAVALATANLLKFSMLVLYPILFIIAVAYFLIIKEEKILRSVRVALRTFIPVACLGFAITIGFYYLAFPGDVFLSADTALDELTVSNYYFPTTPLAAVADVEILRPVAKYFAGIAGVVNRVGGRSSPLVLGRLVWGGSTLFLPISLAFKESIPVIAGSLLALAAVVWALAGRRDSRESQFNLIFVIVPFLVYGAFAAASRFNLGVRHALPALAMLYLFVGWLAVRLWKNRRVKMVTIAFGVWLVVSFVAAFPNPLAYFNELHLAVGMPKYEIFVDSNLDWGQNLVRLADFVSAEGIKRIAVDAWYPLEIVSEYVPQAVGCNEDADWTAVAATPYEISKYWADDPYEAIRKTDPYVVVGDGVLVFRR